MWFFFLQFIVRSLKLLSLKFVKIFSFDSHCNALNIIDLGTLLHLTSSFIIMNGLKSLFVFPVWSALSPMAQWAQSLNNHKKPLLAEHERAHNILKKAFKLQPVTCQYVLTKSRRLTGNESFKYSLGAVSLIAVFINYLRLFLHVFIPIMNLWLLTFYCGVHI